MFGFKKRESPSVQLYGKLPLAKDYLRLGLGDGPGLAFREWLDAAYSGTAQRGDRRALAWPMRFLLGEAWQTCLQGVIMPSSDAGGHRLFPFTICVERRRRAVIQDLQQGSLRATGGVWDGLRALREKCAGQSDGRSLLAEQRGAELAIDADGGSPSGGVDAEVWLQGVWPDRGRAGLEADLERLVAGVAGDAAGPLRLPLMAGCSQRQQVLAWLEVLGRIGLVDPTECPTVFFPEAHVPDDVFPFATVFRGVADPSHGRWLEVPSAADALGPLDLVGGRMCSVPASSLATEGLPPLADSLRITVSNFVRRQGGS